MPLVLAPQWASGSPTMHTFAFICLAAAAPNAWGLLDARARRRGREAGKNRRLSDDFSERVKMAASDAAADDGFGSSVAIEGETIVVGAYAKNLLTGAAYVYRTSDGGTTHDQVAKLTSPGAVGDAFGVSVAVDGAAVVVGASQWLNGGSGSAYVFEEIPRTASSGQSAYNLTSDAARSLPAAATLLAAGAALAF